MIFPLESMNIKHGFENAVQLNETLYAYQILESVPIQKVL